MTRPAVWILLAALSAPAAAQNARSPHFAQLAELIEPGEAIRVTTAGDPQPRPVRVVELTPQVLTVRDGDRQLDLRRGDVLAVHYSVDDSTADGFWHGLTVGLAAFAAAAYAVCGVYKHDCDAGVALAGGIGGVAGGAIGVGLDRLKRTEVRWPPAPRDAWRMTPLLAPDRQGVAVSLSF